MQKTKSAQKHFVLMPIHDVKLMVGLSTATIYSRMAAGKFPRPISTGEGCGKRWLEHEIQEWIRECVRERDKAEALTVGNGAV